MIDYFDVYLDLLKERREGREVSDEIVIAFELHRIANALEQAHERLGDVVEAIYGEPPKS